MLIICNGSERDAAGRRKSVNEGFFTMLGLVVLMLFLSFSLLLLQRAAALAQLSSAQQRVDTYVYLLNYIKTQCISDRAQGEREKDEDTEEKTLPEEWLILRGTTSYRIFWEEDSYAAYQGMHCILRVYVDEEGLGEVRFGAQADI